ncbi:S41 family peptidase [Mucilaginibacter sp. 44-25]|uniref:S41 family peptidase n=1 Tax=Mucilaginibacter sp. 44-25 TaxID=1895794 RepID=UPI00095AADC7|nr:S41 family peptidase [Mucilaginibacter sp. 44-25]OJW13594.1 MAG: hypothetical protein BGO48_00310 [Mucilaginibacter sp. 44-25]
MAIRTLLLTGALLVSSASFGQQKGYYRTPTLHGNTVVFTAEGDLWKYDINTSLCSRLTSDDGVELNPAISPDGKTVAFLGQYEGSTEIYVMDINGGVPRRLTYELTNGQLISGWTKDGKILYRSKGNTVLPQPQLIKLDPANLKKETLPLWQASLGSFDDEGALYFTRFPNQGSKTKRYKGGLIEQLWKFNGRQEATSLTGDFDGTSTSPMYYNGRVYFLSDRDGTMNLWSMDKNGKDLKQQTHSKGWDLQMPSLDAGRIVYQKGADIYLYDIAADNEKLLNINLVSDFDQRKPKWIQKPTNSISFSDVSPKGTYVAIVSRGRLFVSPAKSDRWVEITRKSGIRVKDVHFIDDKTIAALSDEGGEYEVWKVNADGSGEARPITKGSKVIISSFAVSPNGKYIAYLDKNDVLRIAETATGDIKFNYDKSYGGINEISWSPNSTFLNISQNLENLNAQINVIDTRSMKMTPVTTSRTNSYNPAWSADGKWLYFLSDRNLHSVTRSPWGPRQPEPYYTKTTNIYAMALDSAAKFPFLQTDSWLSDSVFTTVDKQGVAKTKKVEKKKPAVQPAQMYNWDAAQRQLYQVPVKSANMNSLSILNGYLYWVDTGDEGDEGGNKIYALKITDSKKHDPTEVAKGVRDFTPAANGKKILIRYADKTLAVADADGSKADADKNKVELNNWSFAINPQQDWQEMFNDAWRMMRDYFYDRDLHKVDWLAVKKQYEPLLPRVTDRYELDDLLSQMVGELSALHTFVYGGDKRTPASKVQTGMLGASLSKTANGFRIDHIYKADPDFENNSPLARPELRIKEGDVITEINNVPLKDVNDIGELLFNKVNIPVKLTLTDRAKKQYEQVVKPISSRDFYDLRYGEWEYSRRLKVDSESNNEIGYVHLKAMGGEDMDDFVKQFYPVFNRKGLVIDVRQNFGGNIDSWVLEKLLRKAWMYWQGRTGGPTWNMQYAFRGHMVLLCDQQTASDGEAVSEGFRRLGLGKVIGMRTWGGEIWLSSDNKLVDDGIATAAETGVFGPEGKWLIEGRGVEPDIEVDNLPYESFKGKDAQLDAAIKYLQQQIKEHPIVNPVSPQHPDKSFKYQ